jgi:signal transduction histidine kinase
MVTIAPEAGGVRLTVADQGIGLPPAELEAIFEPFNRASNAARENLPGLGLGLSICRSLAERHGGRIWAESAGEGQGTRFSLWLPAGERIEESG